MSGIKFSCSTGSSSSKNNPISSSHKPKQSSSKKLLFNDEDEEEEDAQQEAGKGKPSSSSKNKRNIKSSKENVGSLLIQNPSSSSSTKLSRQQKLKQEEAVKLDSSVFEYDEVYDDMKEAEKSIKEAKAQKGAERKPQYISGLIESAKQRQIDRVRAEDKMVQRERESEGAEFADKDSFVTPAYLQQQEELRKAEELEKQKNEELKAKNKEGGMTSFYRNILDEDSKRHEAAVQAVMNKSKNKSLNLDQNQSASQPQYDPEPESVPSEAKLAAEVGAKLGRKVDLDDEGRIVDHRQLLTGGLNLGPPKLVGPQKPQKSGFALPIAERARQEREKAQAEAARNKSLEDEDEDGLNQAEKIKLSRERQSQMLEQQLIELESKKRKAAEEAKIENAKKVARRNDNDKIEALKQKALERRRARESSRKENEGDS